VQQRAIQPQKKPQIWDVWGTGIGAFGGLPDGQHGLILTIGYGLF
jgi:hypothetical protein